MKIKSIKPLYTRIVTTMDMYVEEQLKNPSGIIDVSKLKRGIKEYQTVIEVGTTVRNLKKGDVVCINPDRYAVRKFHENSVKADLMEMKLQSIISMLLKWMTNSIFCWMKRMLNLL